MDTESSSASTDMLVDHQPLLSARKMRMGCMHCHKVIDADAHYCSGCQSTDPFGIKRRQDKWKLRLLLASVMVLMGLWCIYRLGFFELSFLELGFLD